MADNFQPVAATAFSESHKQANHPTPGTGNALKQTPVEVADASDVPDSATFDSAEFTDE